MDQGKSSRFGMGLTLALLSAAMFGTSGTIATGMFGSGWTPLAAVLARVSIGALCMLIPALFMLRGRMQLVRDNWRTVVSYGVFAVALPQLSMFSAVQYMQVAQALLIQYLAPVALVGLLWIRRGERPSGRTIAGSLLAIVGLVLVLQIIGVGLTLDPRGVAWAFAALVGNAAYFVISSSKAGGLPPVVLAAGGVSVSAVVMLAVGLLGLLPFAATTDPVIYAGVAVPWWLTLLVLGVMTAALSYLTGIFGARILGTRLASFVGLSEVLFAIIFSGLLVGQIMTSGQLLGGLLVMLGVVLVKLGEGRTARIPIRRPTSSEPGPTDSPLLRVP